MKKATIYFLTVCIPILFSVTVSQASNSLPNPILSGKTPPVSVEAQKLTNRLDEINAMDKSELSASEKKALRKEVRSTKKELRQVGGGVYVSAGAIVLIIILLIVLL